MGSEILQHVERRSVPSTPGRSRWDHLNEGTFTREMMEAAGHEPRRAHQLCSDEFRDPWSHGDAGTKNVIHDEKSGRG